MNKEKLIRIFLKLFPLVYLCLLISFSIITVLNWNEVIGNSSFIFFLTVILLIILPILVFYLFYKDYICIYRNKIRFEELTEEEFEIIEDAKKLIKEAALNIPSIDIKIYKVPSPLFKHESWFCLDKVHNEICIFISFKKHLKYGKDVCFMAVVHEMLHAYNLRDSITIFKMNFLEGLNQLLTIWLIENYSTKYTVPQTIKFSFKLLTIGTLNIRIPIVAYDEQVEEVKKYLSQYSIDTNDCYLNYINMNPDFFRANIPEPKIYKNYN